MSNSHTVTTHTSWFSRIGRSISGIAIGLILIVGMVVGLFWNEGRAVQTARSLTEGAGLVVSVPADKVDPANENKLVHVTGPVTADTQPSDPDFAITAPGVRLERTVEMYQWIEEEKSETKKELGGSETTVTTYTYTKGWSDEAHNSSNFNNPTGHENPSMEIHSKNDQIAEGKLVAFTLDRPVLDLIGGEKTLPVDAARLAEIDAAYPGTKRVNITEGRIYLGFNPTQPAIGDYRIGYEIVPLQTISVIGRQSGSMFTDYQTEAGDALLMVDEGNVPADKMFANAQAANTFLTWILRLVGIVLLAVGFGMIFAPLAVVADVIPFVGSIVRFGTGLLAFLLAIVVGTITIAIAWFWYRPLLSVIILAVGLAIAVGVYYIGKARRKNAPVTAPGVPPTAAATPT
jgi:hypothetical protein